MKCICVISRFLTNNTDIQAKWLVKIIEKFPLYNLSWLLTGQGNMLRKDEIPAPHTVITVDTESNENIMFVPVKASAGYLNGYTDPEYIDQLAAYRLPGISNGVFKMFEISGQSMRETFENGDKVVGEWAIPTDIKDGHVYIIVSKADGICVKRCVNRFKSDNQLFLQSDNKEFPNITINHEDILEVWSAKLRLTRKFYNPSINRVTENDENCSTILKHAQKFNDQSETNKRIANLETRLASRLAMLEHTLLSFIEQSRSNNP